MMIMTMMTMTMMMILGSVPDMIFQHTSDSPLKRSGDERR
jgi:hypothetical protein